jgi:hypothetical protein
MIEGRKHNGEEFRRVNFKTFGYSLPTMIFLFAIPSTLKKYTWNSL